MAGRLIALTAVIGSGKSLLVRRLREALERENRVIVSRALSLEKAKITVPLLVSALFYDQPGQAPPSRARLSAASATSRSCFARPRSRSRYSSMTRTTSTLIR